MAKMKIKLKRARATMIARIEMRVACQPDNATLFLTSTA